MFCCFAIDVSSSSELEENVRNSLRYLGLIKCQLNSADAGKTMEERDWELEDSSHLCINQSHGGHCARQPARSLCARMVFLWVPTKIHRKMVCLSFYQRFSSRSRQKSKCVGSLRGVWFRETEMVNTGLIFVLH